MVKESDAANDVVFEDVEIPRAKLGAEPLIAYLARSTERGPRPAIVIVHEIFGLNDNIRDIARRFARAGYVSLAVDLFSGGNRRLCIARVMVELAVRPLTSTGVTDLRRAVAWLESRPEVDPARIGAVGFCVGGGYALALACVENNLHAASVFYATNLRLLTSVARSCPIVGSYPADDFTSRSGRRLDAALDSFGVSHDIKIYPGAKHSFFNDTLANYEPGAAADSWNRTLAFFDEHLRSMASH